MLLFYEALAEADHRGEKQGDVPFGKMRATRLALGNPDQAYRHLCQWES